MSLLEEINRRKSKLTHTETVVKTVTGEVIRENQMADGSVSIVSLPMRSAGFVVDLKPDLQVDKIVDGLYMGSQDVVQERSLLDEFSIRHVLSVGVKVLNPFDTINYFYIDALDIPEFDMMNVFDRSFGIIHDAIKVRQENIYVHCNAGVSRSASVVIAYLMKSMGISYNEAYANVKKGRNVIKPNEGFIKQLKFYEQYLNK